MGWSSDLGSRGTGFDSRLAQVAFWVTFYHVGKTFSSSFCMLWVVSGSLFGHVGVTFGTCWGHFFVVFGRSWDVFWETLGVFLDRFGRVWGTSSEGVGKLHFSKVSGSIFPKSGCSKQLFWEGSRQQIPKNGHRFLDQLYIYIYIYI